jgi:addiction module HigA family antidote
MARIRTHPGEVLKEEFLVPLGMSASQLAGKLDVPRNRITAIVNGTRGVTGDSALRLARCFGTTAQFWMNLQSAYDLSLAEKAVGKQIEKAVRPVV